MLARYMRTHIAVPKSVYEPLWEFQDLVSLYIHSGITGVVQNSPGFQLNPPMSAILFLRCRSSTRQQCVGQVILPDKVYDHQSRKF